MTITSLKEAQDRFFELAARAAGGEEVLIAEPGGSTIKMTAQPPASPSKGLRRGGGAWAGRVVIHPDFDHLPADLDAAFRSERECH